MRQNPVQVRRDFLQTQVVVFVAVRAARVVEMPALGLLRCQHRFRAAPRKTGQCPRHRREAADRSGKLTFRFHLSLSTGAQLWVPPLLDDHTAGDPVTRIARRVVGEVVRFGMDHERRAAIVKQ